MCCKSRGVLSRLGLLWGLFSLAALLIAFISGSWLYTKEPVLLPNSLISTSVSFKIGLWRTCPSVKKINATIHVPSPTCVLVKYSGWEDLGDLGIWTNLDLAPVFVSRMRYCTVLCAMAVILHILGVLCTIIGHCNSDNKTVLGCGFLILAGLSLGTGLVIFVSSLSETLLEISQYHKEPPSGPVYDYRYGWCFFTAGLAFIMTNMAALFSISGYLNRFSTVDEMVRQMVPGAERKLLEHHHMSNEYLVHHTIPSSLQYDPFPSDHSKYEVESVSMMNKTPPDVCTTNKCPEYGMDNSEQTCIVPNVDGPNLSVAQTLAGQTIPITIKSHTSTAPLSLSSLPMKYGTMHYDHSANSALNQGFLGVSDLGSSSSTSSSGYCGRSKTLQHSKNKKKCSKIETFHVPDTTFTDFGKRTNVDFSFSGSAV
ncbi:voltage-dependent calcium channel gamma-5 subunit-like [Diorhabda carinulata]|uniref:voltage-dependent calcium channel gamma-5 subunit-like n=1 Tax=Diorhabda carinulata TaxID=1163345 RepID=UPI0025A11C67|nr:voltage-dependent calcium channel gamma-5 subunit-like [Diorhabda carinulata]